MPPKSLNLGAAVISKNHDPKAEIASHPIVIDLTGDDENPTEYSCLHIPTIPTKSIADDSPNVPYQPLTTHHDINSGYWSSSNSYEGSKREFSTFEVMAERRERGERQGKSRS